MPCTQTGSLDGDRILSLSQGMEVVSKENAEMRRLLCEACGQLEKSNLISSMSGALQGWWIIHKRNDERLRRQAEAKANESHDEKKKDLKKLTPRERKLLGL